MTKEIDEINERDEAMRRELEDRKARLASLRSTHDGDLRASMNELTEARAQSPVRRV